jgi:LPXTG-motif cell wall-anchored protein
MTIRHQAGVIAGVLLTFGISVFAPATGRAQDAFQLPEKGSTVTVTGCFGYIDGPHYVLASPTMDPVTSVTTATCEVTGPMIKLDDIKQNGLDKSMVGRWLQVTGRVGKAYDEHPNRIRKLDISSAMFVPVVPPRAAEVIIMPAPVQPAAPVAPQAAPPMAQEQPVATTGTVRTELPKTATSLPLVGLIGLLSLAGGLTLHLFSRRRVGRG